MANTWKGQTPNFGLDLYNIHTVLSDDVTGEEFLASLVDFTDSNAIKIDNALGNAAMKPAFVIEGNIPQFDDMRNIIDSGKRITTSLGNDDETLPTSKAVKTVTDTKADKASVIAAGDIAVISNNGNFTDSGKSFSNGISSQSTHNQITSAKDVYDYVIASQLIHTDYQGMFDYFGSKTQVESVSASAGQTAIIYLGTKTNITKVQRGDRIGSSWVFKDVVPAENNGMWIFAKQLLDEDDTPFGMAIYKSDGVSTSAFDTAPFSMFKPDNKSITLDSNGDLALVTRKVDTSYGDATVLNNITGDNILYGLDSTINQKIDDNWNSLSNVAKSGSYNDLLDKPENSGSQSISKDDIYNDLDIADYVEGKVLDARQGRALNLKKVNRADVVFVEDEQPENHQVFSAIQGWEHRSKINQIIELFKTVLFKADIYNGLDVMGGDAYAKALDARQGGVLKEMIDNIGNNITVPDIIITDKNTGVGRKALTKVTGYDNVAMGREAMLSSTTAQNNVAIGAGAMRNSADASGCVAIGRATMPGFAASIINSCIAIGDWAFIPLRDGNRSIAIGGAAGNYLSNGSTQLTKITDSVFIGEGTRSGTADNQTNQIVIGVNAIARGSNTAHIGNNEVSTISFGPGTGTAFTNRSDARIKENIKDADLNICYEDIKSLPLRRFKYKDFVGNTGDKHLTGFLSEDFGKVLPNAVHKNTASFDELDENGNIIYETITVDGEEKSVPKQVVIEDCESIDTSQLLPTLMGAVQMLIQKVETLEVEISNLKKEH